MAKFAKEQWLGILLILAALLIWVPIPIPAKETIAAIIVVAIGIYKIFF
jgi:hypothetical protein